MASTAAVLDVVEEPSTSDKSRSPVDVSGLSENMRDSGYLSTVSTRNSMIPPIDHQTSADCSDYSDQQSIPNILPKASHAPVRSQNHSSHALDSSSGRKLESPDKMLSVAQGDHFKVHRRIISIPPTEQSIQEVDENPPNLSDNQNSANSDCKDKNASGEQPACCNGLPMRPKPHQSLAAPTASAAQTENIETFVSIEQKALSSTRNECSKTPSAPEPRREMLGLPSLQKTRQYISRVAKLKLQETRSTLQRSFKSKAWHSFVQDRSPHHVTTPGYGQTNSIPGTASEGQTGVTGNDTSGLGKSGKRAAADQESSATGGAHASKRLCTNESVTVSTPEGQYNPRTRIVCAVWANDPEAPGMDQTCHERTWPNVQRMKADHLVKKPHFLKLPDLPTKVNNQERTQKQQFDEVHHWLNPDTPFAVSPYDHERHLVVEQRQRERREADVLHHQPPTNIHNHSPESSDVLSGDLDIMATRIALLDAEVKRLKEENHQLGSAITQLRKDFQQSNLENYTNFDKIFENIGMLFDAQPGGRRDKFKAVQREDENGSQPRSSNTQQDQPHSRKAVGGHCITEQGLNIPDQPGESSFATLAAPYIEPHSVPDHGPSATQQMYPYCCLPGLPCPMHASSRTIAASNDIHPSSLIDRGSIGVNAAKEAWQDQYAASVSPYSALPHSGQNPHVGHNPDWQRGHARVRSRA